jgi:ubiquinone biosynthesis UbiH/UbiF/VisC/COQ6 family hydroxylase
MRYDVIVVGAGLVGASFAVALRSSRYSIALIEGKPPTSPTTEWDSRVYAISPSSKAFLDAVGVWKHLDTARIAPIREMEIFGDRGGRLGFSSYQTGVSELAWTVESSHVQRELWECLRRQSNLTLLCPSQPASMHFGMREVCITLRDGRDLSARLVVAADGVTSWAREAAGVEADVLSYRQQGVVANFETSRPHRETAFQWFRPDGVLAYLPLPGSRISIVWSTPDAHADALTGLRKGEFCDKVAAAGNCRLGSLQLLTPPAAFPLRLVRLPRTVAHRFALIGDAAHAIHPLSGHGINLGFQDARVLAEILQDLPEFRDCGDERLLRRYARARTEEVLVLQMTTHALQRLFSPQAKPVAWLRNVGLNLTDRLPVVREALVRYALG